MFKSIEIGLDRIDTSRKQQDVGVYAIYGKQTGRIYIGSSVSIGIRFGQHLFHLRNGSHKCDQLQQDFINYGHRGFIFFIIEKCPLQDLSEAESEWWALAKLKGKSYNGERFVCRAGNSSKETGIKRLLKPSKYAAIESKLFGSEMSYYKHLEEQRWQGVPVCPHCATAKAPYTVKARGKFQDIPSYRCSERPCGLPFTVRTGTIYEGSKVELRKWFQAAYELSTSKKGISSVELGTRIGVSQKTAWGMIHQMSKFKSKKNGIAGFLETIKNMATQDRERHILFQIAA